MDLSPLSNFVIVDWRNVDVKLQPSQSYVDANDLPVMRAIMLLLRQSGIRRLYTPHP
jgi:hypothetical protein